MKNQSLLASLSLVFVVLGASYALADHIPRNAKTDKRNSIKAANALSRAVSEKCDSPKKTRGKEYQKVWKEIRGICKGTSLADNCSISGKGHSFTLMPLDDKKTRASSKTYRFPKDFDRSLSKYCHDQ